MLKSAILRLRFASSGLVILEIIDLRGGITGSGFEKRVSTGMLIEQPIVSRSHLLNRGLGRVSSKEKEGRDEEEIVRVARSRKPQSPVAKERQLHSPWAYFSAVLVLPRLTAERTNKSLRWLSFSS
jgi:hypothetical protein